MSAKLILLTLSTTFLMSCSSPRNTLSGKTFYYTYLYYTAMNEFGKGGGSRYLTLSFDNDSVTIINMLEKVSAIANGGHETEKDTIHSQKAAYRISGDIVYIENSDIPQLSIQADTLVAPAVAIDREQNPKEFKDVKFTLKQQ